VGAGRPGAHAQGAAGEHTAARASLCLGSLAALRQTITLYRGYGVQAWVFLQDASQLRTLYPDSWPAIVNNCSVVQMFGPKNQRMAQEFASLIGGVRSRTIMQMPTTHQMLLVNGRPMFCQRPNYLKDAMFHGRYDANPMYRSPRHAAYAESGR
jgi:type IV secretion system protein VirD4